jgi:hypothetical protein
MPTVLSDLVKTVKKIVERVVVVLEETVAVLLAAISLLRRERTDLMNGFYSVAHVTTIVEVAAPLSVLKFIR